MGSKDDAFMWIDRNKNLPHCTFRGAAISVCTRIEEREEKEQMKQRKWVITEKFLNLHSSN